MTEGIRRPDLRDGEVPQDALDALWSWVARHPPALQHLRAAIPTDVARRHARTFKSDISLDLAHLDDVRWSVNDQGEPLAFRLRVVPQLQALGVPTSLLAPFFAAGEMGQHQTTLAMKWEGDGPRGPSPDRIGLYYDGLFHAREAEAIRRVVAGLADGPIPPRLPGPMLGAAIDLVGDRVTGFKDYFVQGDVPVAEMAPALQDVFHRVPPDPRNSHRMRVYARRFRQGDPAGQRLGWLPENVRAEHHGLMMDHIEALVTPWGEAAAAWPEVRAWIEAWDTEALGCFVMPGAVAFNVDAAGRPRSVQLYLSVR